MTQSIALLVDSGMNTPDEILSLPGVYEVPLNIIYKEAIYTDKVDISPKEIYDRLSIEIPSTSLPNGKTIHEIFEKIVANGHQEVLVMTISSGLSGTFNALKLMSEDFPELTSAFIDTKSVAIGGGLQAAYAKELIDSQMPLQDILNILQSKVEQSQVYFTLPTLEYLKKGGRIGLVSSVIGSALNLHPVVSCNQDGIYHTVAKARGRKRSIQKMLHTGELFMGEASSYDLAVAHTYCEADAEELAGILKTIFPNFRKFYFSQASPALGIHTGPDAIGFTILKHD